MFRIFFRSDTRGPEILFREGMNPKITGNLTAHQAFHTPASGVAISDDFNVTPYFPVLDATKNTWVYILLVDVSRDLDHFRDVYAEGVDGFSEDPLFMVAGVWAKEACVDRVPGSHIAYAFPVEREFVSFAGDEKNSYCASFKITGKGILNKNAVDTIEPLGEREQHQLSRLVDYYNQRVGIVQQVPNPRMMKKDDFRMLRKRCYFFLETRLDKNELKEVSVPKKLPSDLQLNGKFFASMRSSVINTSGVIFSSKEAIKKTNVQFFKAAWQGQVDACIDHKALTYKIEQQKNFFIEQFGATPFCALFDEDVEIIKPRQ